MSNQKPVQALILAAGQGTRLRPLTNEKPKCLVELAGKSLLDRQAAVLRHAGVAQITVIGGYRAEQIGALGYPLVLNPRYASTNMVATLFCAESLMKDGQDLLIGYGDIVYEPRVLEELLASDAPVALSIDREWQRYWELRMEDPLVDAETLKLDAQGNLTELGKKPRCYDEIQGQYMGLIKIRADRVAAFREAYRQMDRDGTFDGQDFDNMYMTSFLQHLIDTGWELRAALVDNGWLEVDSVEDIETYQAMEAEGRLAPFMRLA